MKIRGYKHLASFVVGIEWQRGKHNYKDNFISLVLPFYSIIFYWGNNE